MAAFVAHQQHVAESRQQPIHHRVFGKEPEPGGDADREPPALASGLSGANKGVKRRRPAGQQHRVGRNDEGGQRHAGQAGIGDSRPESGAPVVEPGRGPVHEKRGGSVQQRRREADRELAVAE